MRRYLLGLALAGALTAAPTFAQNLVTNPDFDVDALNWFHDTSENQQLGTADADACPDSGSLNASSVNTTPGFYYFSVRPLDCVPVTGGETLHASLRYRYSGNAFVRLYFTKCTDSDCLNCGSFSDFLDFQSTSTVWASLAGSWSVPASGVGSVWLSIDANSTVPFTIELDRVYLGRAPRISGDGFEGGSTCRWSSALP